MATTVFAASRDTSPAGIGFCGFTKASAGASVRSLAAPIENWRQSIPSARWSARPTPEPAISAMAAAALASRADGNGWTTRSSPIGLRRPSRMPKLDPAGLDVHDLVESGNEVRDQAGAGVLNLDSQTRHQEMERDCRNHEVTLGVLADRLRRSAATCKSAPQPLLVESGDLLNIGYDLGHTSPLCHIAHEFRDPDVELLVGLAGQAFAVWVAELMRDVAKRRGVAKVVADIQKVARLDEKGLRRAFARGGGAPP